MVMITASVMVAKALESSNLHRRIALNIMVLIGGKPHMYKYLIAYSIAVLIIK